MPYALIVDAKAGVDRRRPISAAPAGSLYDLVNGHISRGGDIEKRKAFVAKYALPAGTFGMQKASGALYVFGSIPDPGMPSGVIYQRLTALSGAAMTAVLDSDSYGGLPYVIAKYADNSVNHFYNGGRVSDWGSLVAGSPSGKGQVCLTHGQKMYVGSESLLQFSATGNCTKWNTGNDIGAGFINMSNHDAGSDALTGIETYRANLAIFSRRTVQLWFVDENDALNKQQQILKRTGTRSQRSVVAVGDADVFYLSDAGVRSLKPTTYTTFAYADDLGTPIDPLILDHFKTVTDQQIQDACAVIEPIDGRYWLAIGPRIFVYTQFPKSGIAAWSYYDPGFVISEFSDLNDRVYARSGDTLYLYGGDNNQTYDSSKVTVQFPFLSSDKPATYKVINGMDMDCAGDWLADILVDPRDLNRLVRIGTFSGISYDEGNTGGMGNVTHMAPRLVCSSNGYARISNIALHFEKAAQES